jgi:hypothetical protein
LFAWPAKVPAPPPQALKLARKAITANFIKIEFFIWIISTKSSGNLWAQCHFNGVFIRILARISLLYMTPDTNANVSDNKLDFIPLCVPCELNNGWYSYVS